MSVLIRLAAPTGLQAIANSWRQWRQRLKARTEFAALGPEADVIARDLSLDGSDLAHLSELPSTSADLLNERMASLGLDPRAVKTSNPAVMRDLQRTCSSCSLKSRCSRDLASEQSAAAVAAYCPNEETLKALRQP